jgi:hypothetical protein
LRLEIRAGPGSNPPAASGQGSRWRQTRDDDFPDKKNINAIMSAYFTLQCKFMKRISAMRTLLMHLDGIEMWKVTTVFLDINGDNTTGSRYEIIEMMDRDMPDAQRFGSSATALAELHALASRDRSLRLERMATRKRRQIPRNWHALRTFWLLSDSVIRASHGRSRASAIRVLRAHRLADRPGAVSVAPPWQAGSGRLDRGLRPVPGVPRH